MEDNMQSWFYGAEYEVDGVKRFSWSRFDAKENMYSEEVLDRVMRNINKNYDAENIRMLAFNRC